MAEPLRILSNLLMRTFRWIHEQLCQKPFPVARLRSASEGRHQGGSLDREHREVRQASKPSPDPDGHGGKNSQYCQNTKRDVTSGPQVPMPSLGTNLSQLAFGLLRGLILSGYVVVTVFQVCAWAFTEGAVRSSHPCKSKGKELTGF